MKRYKIQIIVPGCGIDSSSRYTIDADGVECHNDYYEFFEYQRDENGAVTKFETIAYYPIKYSIITWL